eukprot:g5808.t1
MKLREAGKQEAALKEALAREGLQYAGGGAPGVGMVPRRGGCTSSGCQREDCKNDHGKVGDSIGAQEGEAGKESGGTSAAEAGEQRKVEGGERVEQKAAAPASEQRQDENMICSVKHRYLPLRSSGQNSRSPPFLYQKECRSRWMESTGGGRAPRSFLKNRKPGFASLVRNPMLINKLKGAAATEVAPINVARKRPPLPKNFYKPKPLMFQQERSMPDLVRGCSVSWMQQ